MDDLRFMGGKRFCNALEEIRKNFIFLSSMYPVKFLNFSIRKLSYFPDKEGKVRVIGILDYFSQTVLKNLHHYLYRVLKKIPQDFTFDQGRFKEVVKE